MQNKCLCMCKQGKKLTKVPLLYHLAETCILIGEDLLILFFWYCTLKEAWMYGFLSVNCPSTAFVVKLPEWGLNAIYNTTFYTDTSLLASSSSCLYLYTPAFPLSPFSLSIWSYEIYLSNTCLYKIKNSFHIK